MSNTKQQIEEMISDLSEDAIRYGEELHTGRVKSDEEIKADSAELLQKQTEILEAIDRLVIEAKQDVLKELVEWYEYALSVDDTSFDWYRAVKALMVSKDHKKPFSQLNDKEGE